MRRQDRPFALSLAVYRALLRAWPRGFRERFGPDLAADAAELFAAEGRLAAWRRLLADLARSAPRERATARRRPRGAEASSAPTPKQRQAATRRVGAELASAPLCAHAQEEGAMASLLLDVRHAARALAKAPAFTAVTIATLALGIGANTAVFSLVDAALLRPLGFPGSDRLVMIHEGIPEAELPKMDVSVPDLLDLEEYQRSFAAIGAFRTDLFEVSGKGEPERVPVARVSASLLPALGVEPALGRGFTAEEDAPGNDVAILSHGFWQRRFGGDPGAVGGVVRLDRRPYTIVGVMPAGFEFPRRGLESNDDPAEVYVPIAFTEYESQARGSMYNNSVVARLAPGVTLAEARSEVEVMARRILANYPPALSEVYTLTLTVTPLAEEISGRVERPLLVLLGAVGLVLLVACANVANLVLSRAAAREREIGVRAALGASRRRLFQMLAAESLLLAVAGGAFGLAAGAWAVRAVPSVIAEGLPGVSHVALDGRVLAFAAILSFVTAVVFGAMPLVAGGGPDLQGALGGGGGRTATAGLSRHRLQGALVVSTVGLACVLLAGAGLLVRSFVKLLSTDPGFRPQRVLTMIVSLPPEGYATAAGIRAFLDEATGRLASLPGAGAAAVASDLPFISGERRAFTPEGSVPAGGVASSLALTWVQGDYFETFGIPLVRGRAFTAAEHAESRDVVVISRALADRFWPGEDPIGKRLKWGVTESRTPWLTVVGVVADVADERLGALPTIHAYEPYRQLPDGQLEDAITGLTRTLHLAVLTRAEPEALAARVRAEIAALDPALAVARMATMEQRLADNVAPQRFSMLLLGGFAAGALLLAAIGLYGVLAFAVAQRTREIGVRMALGARRAEVVRMVVRQGMALVAIGLALGLAAALAATRLMSALLYETEPHDPWTYALVPAVLAAVAALACWLPARRASKVDPIVALKVE